MNRGRCLQQLTRWGELGGRTSSTRYCGTATQTSAQITVMPYPGSPPLSPKTRVYGYCTAQVGGMMSSHRQVQVGRPYALPPQLFGVPPTAVAGGLDGWRDTLRRAAAMAAQQQQQAAAQRQRQKAQKGSPGAAAAAAAHGEGGGGGRGEEEGQKAPEGRLVDGFLRAFHGVSPALVEELCGRAGARVCIKGVVGRVGCGALDASGAAAVPHAPYCNAAGQVRGVCCGGVVGCAGCGALVWLRGSGAVRQGRCVIVYCRRQCVLYWVWGVQVWVRLVAGG